MCSAWFRRTQTCTLQRQLVLAHIDEDPGQPGLEELGCRSFRRSEGAVPRPPRPQRAPRPGREGCAVELTLLVLGPEAQISVPSCSSLPFDH